MKFVLFVYLFTPLIQCHMFRFANHYADHMVLQSHPLQALLWGFGEENSQVTISLLGRNYTTTVIKDSRGLNIWEVILDKVNAGGPYAIEGQSRVGNNVVTIKLQDVLFGDVWFCSGQSNMGFTVGMSFNGTEEIENASKYPDIRLFTTNRYYSSHTEPEIERKNILQQWTLPTKRSIDGGAWRYFSAVCWMFGRRLYSQFKRPVGLIASYYRASIIEAWTSPEVLQICGIKDRELPEQNTNSVLWNAMIYPFLNTTIYGVIWYQGESNAMLKPEKYECLFPEMVSSWREEWFKGTHQNTDLQFPFGFVQLAGLGNDLIVKDFPTIRWNQMAGYNHVPNAQLPNTFMAVAIDILDKDCPYGSIHPRYKEDIAQRLFLGALNIAYNNKSVYFTGPILDTVVVDKITKEHIQAKVFYKYLYHDNGIVTRINQGFQALFSNNSQWIDVTISSYIGKMLTIPITLTSGVQLLALRYAWSQGPCAYKKCAVYAAGTDLPSPPTIAYVV